MTKQVTRTLEFNNRPVAFLVTANEVMVNANDLLQIEYEEVLVGTNEELFETVFDHLYDSDYDHHWCVIDASDKKKIVIWLREEFAIQFASEMSSQLGKWCSNRLRIFNKQRDEIMASEEDKPIMFYDSVKEPSLEEYYECDSSDKPHEGLTQTFYYCGDPVSLCCDENEILVNTTQMFRIFKKERKEWLELQSTDSLTRACAARGQTLASCYGKDKEIYSIWNNITIAEHLALWLEKKPNFKLWLQDRAAELKFFKDTANSKSILTAYRDMNYLATNCVISRN